LPAPKDLEKYDEWKKKIGEANKVSLKGNIPWNKGLKGSQVAWNKGLKGRKHTQETKDKISKSGKGRKHTEESKEKMRQAALNRKHIEESKKKMSESKKGKTSNMKGKKHTKESKKKMSDSLKGKPVWNKGIPMTEDQIKKSSEAQLKFWAGLTDEERIKRTEHLRNFNYDIISSIEIAIINVLDKINEPYIQQYIYKYFYIDIYLPQYNLFIECNGDYWHSLPRRKRRDKYLTEFSKNDNINLIWLWEKEIRRNPIQALLNGLKKLNDKNIHMLINKLIS
jgi:hypothetical protein